jgi:hypothetical protein
MLALPEQEKQHKPLIDQYHAKHITHSEVDVSWKRDSEGSQLCCSRRIRHCDLILLQCQVRVDMRKLFGFTVYQEDIRILFQPG